MIIRRMTEDDLAEVICIENENFHDPWSEKAFLDSMENENNCYLVVIENKTVVGYCAYWGVLDEGQICNVSVKKEFQGHKIGFSMMEELIKEGVLRGIKAFTLEVRVSNTKAIALYQKLGFVSAGIRKDFYSHPKEDAYIMWYYAK